MAKKPASKTPTGVASAESADTEAAALRVTLAMQAEVADRERLRIEGQKNPLIAKLIAENETLKQRLAAFERAAEDRPESPAAE